VSTENHVIADKQDTMTWFSG